MSDPFRAPPTAVRVSLRCVMCGEYGHFDQDWRHDRVPSFRHRFVPDEAPTEAQQDRLEAQHVADFGPIPEPHEVGCPCGLDHDMRQPPLEETL